MGRPNKHIDTILKQWPYEPGDVSVRLVKGSDGREVLQMRIDMGLLQLEVDKKPDGSRPGDQDTYLDHLRNQLDAEGEAFQLSDEQCAETDREFVQFYQRRLCWLAMREFHRAIRDANHSLALMDLVKTCSPSEEWTASHEQYRPFVLFHRAQAAALAELDDRGADAAIEQINIGLEQMQAVFEEHEASEEFADDELVQRLEQLREAIREHYQVGATLSERLAEAVANEQYELAAQLRDELNRRQQAR